MIDIEWVRALGGVSDEVFVGGVLRLLEGRKDMLRAASDLGHAALDGVVDELEQEFAEALQNPRHRQFVGAAIRRVMEPMGYRLENKAVRVRRGNLFTVAARYERAPGTPPPPLQVAVSADAYAAEVEARLDWMEDNGRSIEERAKVIEIEHAWIAHRYDSEVAEAWIKGLAAKHERYVFLRPR